MYILVTFYRLELKITIKYEFIFFQDEIDTTLIAEHDSKFRLTCVSVYTPMLSTNKSDTSVKSEIDQVTVENNDSEEVNSSEDEAEIKKLKKQKKRDKLKKTQEKRSEKESLKRKLVTLVEEDVKDAKKKKKVKDRKMIMQKQKSKKIKS
jgi:hypothetical protein